MCYDYNYPQTYARANSPFYDDYVRRGIRRTVEQQSSIFGKDKLIIGLPFYGYDYIVSSDQAGASIISMYDWVYLRDIDWAFQLSVRQRDLV